MHSLPRVDALTFVSFVATLFPCACGGKASYDSCPVTTGGSASLNAGGSQAGNFVATTGGTVGAGGSTTITCPATGGTSQEYCPSIAAR